MYVFPFDPHRGLRQGSPHEQVQEDQDHYSLCDLKAPDANPESHEHASRG